MMYNMYYMCIQEYEMQFWLCSPVLLLLVVPGSVTRLKEISLMILLLKKQAPVLWRCNLPFRVTNNDHGVVIVPEIQAFAGSSYACVPEPCSGSEPPGLEPEQMSVLVDFHFHFVILRFVVGFKLLLLIVARVTIFGSA